MAPPWLAGALSAAKQSADNGGNIALQESLARFILDGHLARYTRQMRKRYARRRDTLVAAIERELSEWLIATAPGAGIHLSARYRDRRQANRIASLAQHDAVGAQPIGDFLIERNSTAATGLAFGFGCIDEAEIDASIGRLSRALNRD